ncbi:unnamed protein product [Haemonchus placei]|uniref:Glyco_hydro_19_cat domain-containing protein n=1 Tax=Haemonchus placei TaxID=6290 RepID=A0A0N4X373_HAEPC|nr:unnamed protein product [Haemonchus placei]
MEREGTSLSGEEKADCFYRGGFYNWFERGPNSSFLLPAFPGFQTVDGKRCTEEGRYCKRGIELDYWSPCNESTEIHAGQTYHRGCYFGRGALQVRLSLTVAVFSYFQLSWNYNYGLFQQFLLSRGIKVDLINNPNLVVTKMDPPLAMLASLWFYMTPQPPKPSMHSIVVGDWRQSEKNRRAGFGGPIFGPTSLVINNECGGEDPEEPANIFTCHSLCTNSAPFTTIFHRRSDMFHSFIRNGCTCIKSIKFILCGPGESRRIKAFKWFCNYFEVPAGPERSLSCKGMLDNFDAIPHMYSWQPDWGNMWRARPKFVKENDRNRLRCVYSIYESPSTFRLDEGNAPCLKYKPKISLTKTGFKD